MQSKKFTARLIFSALVMSNILGAIPITKSPIKVNPRASARFSQKKEKNQTSADDINVDSDEAPDVRDSRNALILTIDSKIDFLQNTTDLCCATLNSKIDALHFDSSACCATLNSKIDNLEVSSSKIDFDINACCSTLNSKLDILVVENLCDATPILSATTITAAGTYCLAQNISSVNSPATIEISASNVILDLNGHRLANSTSTGCGVIVDAGASNVVIRNGFIETDNSASVAAGILLNGNNVRVEDVIVGSVNSSTNQWSFGIQILSNGAVIANSQFHNAKENGIYILSAKNVLVENCYVNNSASEGIFVTGTPGSLSSNIKFVECESNSNLGDGIFLNGGTNAVKIANCSFDGNSADGIAIEGCECIVIDECSANNALNNNTQYGYNFLGTSSNILISNSFACGFTTGFTAIGTTALNIVNCVAKGNNIGFDTSGLGNEAIVQGCLADNNNNTPPTNGIGFKDNGTSQFYSNRACNNGINYFGVTTAPITSAANARGVMNVDCSLTTTDQIIVIESNLDQCCFTLNSKVDGLAAASSKIDADLNNCCFTLSSQIDALDVIDLRPCCYTLESKIDDVIVLVQQVDTDILDCCSTLNSKVDSVHSLDATILSHIDGVQDSLNGCCFTLSSQIDRLDFVDLANCCSTVNSKIDVVSTLDSTILSHVDGVQDSLNACCFTIDSKIDALNVIDLTPCCFTLDSKIDSLTKEALTIESKVDALTVIVDDNFAGVAQALTVIYNQEVSTSSKVDLCCATLNSKLDSLSSEAASSSLVDQCCATLTNLIDDLNNTVVTDFAGTFTVLSDISSEQAVIEGQIAALQADLDNCCFVLQSKVDKVQVTDTAILNEVTALTTIVENDFAGTFTVLNSLTGEVASSSLVDQCCTTLSSKIDALTGLVDADFAAVLAQGITTQSKVDALTVIVDDNFAGVSEALTVIFNQEVSTSSKVDLCCSTLNSKLDSLSSEAASSSVVDQCCATLTNLIDNLSNTVETDFAGTFTVLSDISSEQAFIENQVAVVQADLTACCFTLQSKVDKVQTTDNTILTTVNTLVTTVNADFAGTFTTLNNLNTVSNAIESKVDNVQLTDNAVLSELDACCFTLSSQVDSLSTDNFNLNSKLDTCCFVLDSKIQFLIDNVLLP